MEESEKIVLFNEKFTSWEEALEAFILFRKAEGHSKRTIEDYRYHIAHLFKERPQAFDPAHPGKTKAATGRSCRGIMRQSSGLSVFHLTTCATTRRFISCATV